MSDGPISESPEGLATAPPPLPLTLVQRAYEAQKVWAPRYAQVHRVRRRVSWVIAAILAVYVSWCAFQMLGDAGVLAGLGCAVFAGYIPLHTVMLADQERRDGDWPVSSWVVAWVILVMDAALGSIWLAGGKYLMGVTCVLSALGIGALLSWGLRIPDDPSIDRDLALFEQFSVVRSARGGRSYAPIIDSPRKAEEIAAAWLRRMGYPDARVTPVGADDGVDVNALRAVAQVKWTKRPIGASDVRDLAGTGKAGQARFFFSKSGYTKPTLKWASDLEHPVGLFIMGDDGNVVACNYRAKRSLWRAPAHMPVAFRRPPSRLTPWISVTAGVFSLVGVITLTYLMTQTFVDGQVVTGVLFCAVLIVMAAVCVSAVVLPTIRISGNILRGRPAGIRESFERPPPPDVDGGLPSDTFVGFEPDMIVRMFDRGVDLWVQSRFLRRVLSGRAVARSSRSRANGDS